MNRQRAQSTVLLDLSILMTDTRVRGIGRYVADLATQMMDVDWGGLRIRFLETIGPMGKPVISDDGAASVRRLLDPDRRETRNGVWHRRMRYFAERAVRAAGADLFHQPHKSPMPLWVSARNLVSCMDIIPLLYPDHYLSWKSGGAPGQWLRDKWRLNRADHIVAISQATKDTLLQELSIPCDDVTVVHLGIDHDRFHARAQNAPVPQAGKYFLYVGDADWRKNHSGMFEALKIARRTHDCELVCLGRLAPKRHKRVVAAARKHGVRGKVHLPGWVDDDTLRAYYRHAVATLFVSHEEGFGFPVIEAMASGCPVITSNRSSMAEIAGDAALLVAPSDPHAIAGAMVRMLDDADLRGQLRDSGLAHAAGFTGRAVAEKTVAVYRRLRGDA